MTTTGESGTPAHLAQMEARSVDAEEGMRLYVEAEWQYGKAMSNTTLDVAEDAFYGWCCENVPALLAVYREHIDGDRA